MSTVVAAKGTKLSVDFTTPSTYVEIAQVTKVSSSSEVGSAETTHLGSTQKTFRPTIFDAGEITFEVEYDPGDTVSHQKLETMHKAAVIHSWKITYPDSGTSTDIFDGFITKLEKTADGVEDNLMASLTVKLTGADTGTGG